MWKNKSQITQLNKYQAKTLRYSGMAFQSLRNTQKSSGSTRIGKKRQASQGLGRQGPCTEAGFSEMRTTEDDGVKPSTFCMRIW